MWWLLIVRAVRLERGVPADHDLVWFDGDEDDATVSESDPHGDLVEFYRLRRYAVDSSREVRYGPPMAQGEAAAFDAVWDIWRQSLDGCFGARRNTWVAPCALFGLRLEPFCDDFASRERVWQNLRLSCEDRGFRLQAELDRRGEPWVVAQRARLD